MVRALEYGFEKHKREAPVYEQAPPRQKASPPTSLVRIQREEAAAKEAEQHKEMEQ